MKRLENVILFMSPRGVMQFDGARLQPLSVSYDPTRYQKEKMTMKPGPYKSSTHGEIPLSLRGRELMQNLRARQEACAEQASCAFETSRGRDLAESRGNLAKYMSELESYAGRFFDRAPRDVKHEMGEPPSERNHQLDAYAYAMRAMQPQNLPKETEMTDKTNGAGATPVEKTRSQLIAEATQELVQAQRELEYITEAPADAVNNLRFHVNGSGILGEGIRKLVVEQFDAMRKKVTARAKVRVAKAEKAVAALVS